MKRTVAFALSVLAIGSLASAAQAFEMRTVDLNEANGSAHYTDPDQQQPYSTSTSTTRNWNGTDTTTTNRAMGPFNFSSSFTGGNRAGNGPDPAGFPSSGFTTGHDMMRQR
jgi:hypothetical protein